MTTLIKIIITSILSLILFSCNFDINLNSGVKGNGTVTTQERTINEPYTAIKATEGLNIYLTQSNNDNIIVEADENLQDLIVTEVKNGVLKIHTKQNIGRSTSKKVMINFKDISSIISTSGSNIYTTNTINADKLNLKTSSGSNIKLDVNTTVLICKSSSGSDLILSGKTESLTAEASSGSAIIAEDLIAQTSQVNATSGADITLNTSKKLIAKATSGGDIKYYGNPDIVEKNNNVSGNIRKK